jgi:hypothetical protein
VEHVWQTVCDHRAGGVLGHLFYTVHSFHCVRCRGSTLPHDIQFGIEFVDAVSYSTVIAYALCWPWILRHANLEKKQLRKVGLAKYFNSLWNVVDSLLVLEFISLGFALALGYWLLVKYLSVVATLLVFLEAVS